MAGVSRLTPSRHRQRGHSQLARRLPGGEDIFLEHSHNVIIEIKRTLGKKGMIDFLRVLTYR